MSWLRDLFFPPQNRHHYVPPQDQDNGANQHFIQPRGFFAEFDRIMQDMMQEHFQSMDLHFGPHQHNFQIEDNTGEDLNLRDRMLKKPEREYNQIQREPIPSTPHKDINLDNAIQDNPHLIDRIFHDNNPTNSNINHPEHGIQPFSNIFSPDIGDNPSGKYTIKSHTMVVTRGSDGQVKYRKREVREDSQGNRQVIESSSDDKDNIGNRYLQDNDRITPDQRIGVSPGLGVNQDGVFQMIKKWFYPPKDD